MNLRRLVTILIAVLFTEHISAQDNIIVPQIQPPVQTTSPISIKIAAEKSGKRVYYSVKEWGNISVEEKLKINKIGLIISQGDERFLLALNPLSPNNVDWETALTISGNQMPTKKHWQIILQNINKINRLLDKGLYGDWWILDTQYAKANITIAELERANKNDKVGVWLATEDIDNGFKEIIIDKPNGEDYDYVGGDYNGSNNYYRLVRYKNKYGFIDTTGAIVIPLKYDDVYFGEKYNGMSDYWADLDCCVSVCQNGKWGYINSAGETVLPLMYDKVERLTAKNGCARVMKEKLVGAISNDGTFSIPIMYDELEKVYNSKIMFAKKNGKYGFIDKSNNIVIPFKYDFTSGFNDGLAVVGIAGKYGYIDEKGEEVIPLIYEFAEPFCGGLAAVAKNGKLGYINREGETTIPFKYKTSYVNILYDYYGLNIISRTQLRGSFEYGYATVETDNEKWGIINKKGEFLTDCKYDRITGRGSDGVTAIYNNKEVYIDVAGNEYSSKSERAQQSTEKMARQGYPEAMYKLGQRFYNAKEYLSAIEWFEKGALQNNIDCLYKLGTIYYNGNGVEKSYSTALKYFLGLIDNVPVVHAEMDPDGRITYSNHTYDVKNSLCHCGLMYYYGGNGIERSYAIALKYFTKADELYDEISCYFLGWMYEHGQGTDKDINQAIKWYEKSRGYKDSKERIAKLKESTATSGTINGHEWVDLGLSVKWATCNVGATVPSDYGDYFAWGETTTKSFFSERNYFINSLKASVRKHIGDISGDPRYDAARTHWGSTWRLPTYKELKELKEKCQWTWTEQNGHNGYKITGPNGNFIFLPAAGWCMSKVYHCNIDGNYWSAIPYSLKEAYYVICGSGSHAIYHTRRWIGCSVRPVSN